MKEIHELRNQYLAYLRDAGFVGHDAKNHNRHCDDALLTSCCLVAGLYPNVCTLMRPRKGGPKGGRLLTKEGNVCRPQSQSFQRSRIQRAAESGKDAYAVYHTKHQSVGTKASEVFLSEVNFVSRYALLLFGGELEIVKNAVIVDGWLKFKVDGSETSLAGAVLLLALRDELDASLLRQIAKGAGNGNGGDGDAAAEMLDVIKKILMDE